MQLKEKSIDPLPEGNGFVISFAFGKLSIEVVNSCNSKYTTINIPLVNMCIFIKLQLKMFAFFTFTHYIKFV